MACDCYKTLPEEKNEKKYGRNQCQNMSVEKKPKVKVCGKQCRRNLSEKDNKKRKNTERIQKKSVNNLLKQIKEKDELKSVEVDVVSNFTEDKVESSADTEIYTDDNDDLEEYGMTVFR